MSSRRSISNLGDVQIALNDLFDQMDKLRTKAQDFQGRQLTGIADAKVTTDAVNLGTMQAYVLDQITILAKTIPPKQTSQPLNAADASFDKNILPKADSTYSIGSSALKWLKGWFKNLNIDSLTVSLPVKTDASKNLVSGAIGLSTADVSGILAASKGGTGTNSLTAHAVILGNAGANVNYATIGTAGKVLTDNGAGVDPSFKLPANLTNQSDVSGSRVIGTNYLNSTGKNLYVGVWAHSAAGLAMQAFSDNTTTPTLNIASVAMAVITDYVYLFFIVLAGNYYRIDFTGATLDGWVETY